MNRRLVLLLVLVVALGACGVARGGTVKRIAPEELGGLDDTLPNTTTSTTVVPQTTLLPTTTLVPTANVTLYFLAGDQLTPYATPLSPSASHGQVLAVLQAGPTGDAGRGLRSAVPRNPNLLPTVSDDGSGVAKIDLPPNFFDAIQPTSDQRLAIAQIARTMLDRPGIGQVSFTLAGQPTEVPRGNGETAAPGALLTRLDFDILLESAPPATSTTTTSPTTVPPPSEAPPAPTPAP